MNAVVRARLPPVLAACAALGAACAARSDVVLRDALGVAHVTGSTTQPPAGAVEHSEPAMRIARLVAPAAQAQVLIDGHAVDSTGLVLVRALELACLADGSALTDPRAARARFEDIASSQLIPLGELSFVLLTRDPARSITDPAPQLCRTIASHSALRAPLVRAREPARRWLVRRIESGLVDDAARVWHDGKQLALKHTAPPRVLLADTGTLVAVALPVADASTGEHE